MDLSQLLGEIDSDAPAGDASAPDLLKDIEQFTKEQNASSPTDRPTEGATTPKEATEPVEPAFSALSRQPMLGVEVAASAGTITTAPPATQELPTKTEAKEPATKTETIQSANGTRYIGELRNGKPHGKGCIYYSNGSHYEGGFDQGDKSGFGVHEWTNTVRYEGQWRAGKKEGEGIIVFPDGSRLHATFRDDECVQGQLWKDGVLKHSGPCDPVFLYVPPSSSCFSLHINFVAPLEDDSLRLVYQRLRMLHKADSKPCTLRHSVLCWSFISRAALQLSSTSPKLSLRDSQQITTNGRPQRYRAS